MRSINKVILLGRLTRDAEVVNIPGYTLVKFTVATDRSWKTASGEWKKEVEFTDVERWGGDKLAPYLLKGLTVLVEGRKKTEKFEKNGEKRSAVKVMADVIEVMEKPANSPNYKGKETGETGEEVPFDSDKW